MPILYIAVMAVAFLLDRVVKNWAAGPLVDVHGGVLPLIPGAIALALGGALGNLYDRVVLGYVIDMFDFCLINFAVFNVADSFVNIGVVMLAIWMVFFEEKDKRRGDFRWGRPLPQVQAEERNEESEETHEELAMDRDEGR